MNDLRIDKFIHERLLEAKPGAPLYGEKVLARGLSIADSRKEQFAAQHLYEAVLPDGEPNPEWVRDEYEDSVANTWLVSLALMKCLYPKPSEAYVFAKEFFEDLLSVDVTRLAFDMFPIGFRGVFRFPRLLSDEEGEMFDEVCVTVLPAEELERLLHVEVVERFGGEREVRMTPGYKAIVATWQVKGAPNFGGIFLTAGSGRTLSDAIDKGWDRSVEGQMVHRNYNAKEHAGHIRAILTAVVYVLSGQPDLREFRNTIKRKSPESQSPVRADKVLSAIPIKLVGYNWKKLPAYGTGVWTVKPFLRFQPYGPGRSQVKLTLVREHERRRDPSLIERARKKTQTDSDIGAHA